MSKKDFHQLKFQGFAELAKDSTLSKYEKIGFPDSYRAGYEDLIFKDICAKMPQLNEMGKVIVDIGPGCSDLPMMLIKHCRERQHQLILIDSEEMLDHLPNEPFIRKISKPFPRSYEDILDLKNQVDVIICYSVFQYVFKEFNPFDFVDVSLNLLKSTGNLLIGDIPNNSKRRRFFSSDQGIAYHQAFTGTNTLPDVSLNSSELSQIDDSVIFAILQRARLFGMDAYVVPQDPSLPMANRREDILIYKP